MARALMDVSETHHPGEKADSEQLSTTGRSRTLAEFLSTGLVGRELTCHLLASFLAGGRVPSLLLSGPESSGKRTTALRFAQAANCTAAGCGNPDSTPRPPCGRCRSCRTIATLDHPDVRVLFPVRRQRRTDRSASDDIQSGMAAIVEQTASYALDSPAPALDPGLTIPVDAIRWVRHEMSRPPFSARRRFFIILHAERMTPEAANAFLKTLEEPQPQTTLTLTTSAPSLLPDTVRSRCRFIRFPAVPGADISRWLTRTREADPARAALAAEFCDGSPGRALRFLESPDEYLDPRIAEFFLRPESDERRVIETLDALSRTPLAVITSSFLFLLDQLLRARHGLPSCYATDNRELLHRAQTLSDDYLRRAIHYILDRLDETRLSTNRRLFLYTLLASLRHAS